MRWASFGSNDVLHLLKAREQWNPIRKPMCYISFMSADACRTGTAAEADVPARFKVHSL